MSMYCANKYAIIDARTATTVAPKTVSKRTSSTGDQSVAGTTADVYTIRSEKTDANIPGCV